jgi:hypothetical protein
MLGYTRVSTSEQATSGLGLAAQRSPIEQEARRRGCELVEVISDEAVSGKDLDRAGLLRALRPGDTVLATTAPEVEDARSRVMQASEVAGGPGGERRRGVEPGVRRAQRWYRLIGSTQQGRLVPVTGPSGRAAQPDASSEQAGGGKRPSIHCSSLLPAFPSRSSTIPKATQWS